MTENSLETQQDLRSKFLSAESLATQPDTPYVSLSQMSYTPDDLQAFSQNYLQVLNSANLKDPQSLISNLSILLQAIIIFKQHVDNTYLSPLIQKLGQLVNQPEWAINQEELVEIAVLFEEGVLTGFIEELDAERTRKLLEVGKDLTQKGFYVGLLDRMIGLVPAFSKKLQYSIEKATCMALTNSDQALDFALNTCKFAYDSTLKFEKEVSKLHKTVLKQNQELSEAFGDLNTQNEKISNLTKQLQMTQYTLDKTYQQNITLSIRLEHSNNKCEELTKICHDMIGKYELPPPIAKQIYSALKVRTIGVCDQKAIFEYDGVDFVKIPLGNFKTNRFPSSVILPNGDLFISGGYPEYNCIITNGYRVIQISKLLFSRNFHASVYFDGRVYVFGGQSTCGSMLKQCEYYDLYTQNWHRIENLPEGRCVFTGGYYNGYIYIGGGYSSYNAQCIYKYNIELDTFTLTSITTPYANVYTTLVTVGEYLYILQKDKFIEVELDEEEQEGEFDIANYQWWSSIQPAVVGDYIYFALAAVSERLVRLDIIKKEVLELGTLKQAF